MKQDDIITLSIRDVGMCGEGIAQYEDHTVFVPFALPDEQVEVKIDHVNAKRHLAYATLRRVLTASSHRVEPQCLRYGKCGGCDLMHADYDYQREVKTRLVATTLRKAKVPVEVSPCVASPRTLGYRNKISLSFGRIDGRTVLGLYREGTHRVVSLRACPLHDRWATDLVNATLSFVNACGLSVFDGATGKGLLRHLVARHLGDHTDVTLVINGRSLPHWQQYAEALAGVLPQYTLYVSPNTRNNNVVMGEEIFLVAGEPYTHTIEGVAVQVNPLSFLQVNDDVCARLYETIVDVVDPRPGRVVVDAFAGVGVLGAIMAKRGADVYNIEIVKEAVDDADRLAVRNRVKVHNLCGDSAVLLPQVLDMLAANAPHVYNMHLQRPYFDAIAAGRKTHELRLAEPRRRAIAAGDLIRFECEGEYLYCRVGGSKVYPDFASTFAELGTQCTMAEPLSQEAALRVMRGFYAPAEETQGVIALEVSPVNASGIAVVLDPPRKGCPESVVESLRRLGAMHARQGLSSRDWPTVTLPYVERVVYVSCNPATLARDLAQLQTVYAIDSVQPFDMFPMTRHVETVARLSRQLSSPNGE